MPAIEKNQKKSNGGRGGRRQNAGRKAGSATKKTREIANRAAEEGITPLEYMLRVMRQETDHEDPKIAIAREAMAFEAAKAAAPYVHPRLAAIEHTGPEGGPIQQTVELSGMSTETLAEIMRAKDAAHRR